LAEVVFPAGTAIHEAKEYIFRELQEIPVQSHGHSMRWVESAEQLALSLADDPDHDAIAVPLHEGVGDLAGPCLAPPPQADSGPGHTCRGGFARSAGWTRERAAQWVEKHLQVRLLGRAVLLNPPHRMAPALAEFLSGLLFEAAPVVGLRAECPKHGGPAKD